MKYWEWESEAEATLVRNVCGPNQTLATIDDRSDSIVWLLKPTSEDVCLDLGCAVGRVEKHLAPLVKEIHGVDFSGSMLAVARRRLRDMSNVSFHQNDGETLSMFDAEMFDLAWAELIFHHVPIEVTEGYLKEVARVLKPGGRFICQLPLSSFYRTYSRGVCGWLTTDDAERLMKSYFGEVTVSDDGRHILARGRMPFGKVQQTKSAVG
jgi:ubiquinone/menaquinone biosynthesis C-methylase UbiE